MSDIHHHDHAHDHHSGGGGHHAPTSFWRRYVFSTDHKVIGMQFMFVALLFVVLGGLLALGVRYQLAWPMQNVPFFKLLPGNMTSIAPEANVAFWKTGHRLKFPADFEAEDGSKVSRESAGTFAGFPDGIAVTLPRGLEVRKGDAPAVTTLAEPVEAFIKPSYAMGDYDYNKLQVRTSAGVTVTVPGQAGLWKIVGYSVPTPDDQTIGRPIVLPVRPEATRIEVKLDSATVVTTASKVLYEKHTLTTDAYLQLFTMHATLMIFFVIIPMLVGAFANFLVPLMIGARDMAFPKLNMLSFWISVPAGILIMVSFWTPGGAAGGGWTMYPPLSEHQYTPQLGTSLWIAAVGLVGFSSVVGALNYITTIINMRAPGMTMFRMPLTVWAVLITATLACFATPVLTAAMVLLLLDRIPFIHTMFFIAHQGGQPILFQHLFWFYSHPAVYIMILPAMGIASDILSTFCRKPIFGYKPMVFAISGIAGLGFIVWGHHMFQSGMNPILGTTFMASTVMIALPSAIKTFNWLGTIWGGNVRFTVPMLFALGFVSMFVIGGLSGIFMASAPVDIHIHDTYFIVAHIHYVLFGGSIMGIFAGIYHWFPKMFGRQMNQRWGHVHFWMTFLAFNGTFFLMHIMGIGGHPRRYATIYEYPAFQHLQPLNVITTIWAMMLGMAQIPFLYNFFVSLPRKLGRAMVAFYLVAVGLPAVMGLTYYHGWAPISSLGQTLFGWASYADDVRRFWPAISLAALAGALYAVAVVVIVFAVWAVGGALRLPALLQRLLYLVFLPAFLAPMVLKPDLWVMRGVPALHDHRWLILALLVLPGLLYLVLRRPRDEFGYAVDNNPWHANTLEWQTTSPPPHTNFETIPTVYRGPYEYSSPVVEEDFLPQDKPLPAGVVEPAGH